MLPAAPARCSTMLGWSHFSRNLSATIRAMRSSPPPGVLLTMILMGLAGNSCAWTAAANPSVAAAKATMANAVLVMIDALVELDAGALDEIRHALFLGGDHRGELVDAVGDRLDPLGDDALQDVGRADGAHRLGIEAGGYLAPPP